jgi:cation diffusion facilitator CzcD-associated flavoprotein CzcO
MCNKSETPGHILTCTDGRAITSWHASLLKLEARLIESNTYPALITPLIQRLRSGHDSTPRHAILSDDENVHSTFSSQDAIGWYPFIHGHISHYWAAVQQSYYDSLEVDNTGSKWATQLLLKLFNTSWDMWEHRNGIKHKTLTAAKRRAIRRLDNMIREEYQKGDRHLLAKDKQWLSHPM